jgi:predicted helicase
LFQLHDDRQFNNISDPSVSKKEYAISDRSYKKYVSSIGTNEFSKEDMFYFVYAILHHPEYLLKFETNLSLELPRIPVIKHAETFFSLVAIGRKLAEIHVEFEKAIPHKVKIRKVGCTAEVELGDVGKLEKIKRARENPEQDETLTIALNSNYEMFDIPARALEYRLSGKSALDWVIDRQKSKTDRPSGISNNASDYAKETIGSSEYQVLLLAKIVTVSLESLKLIESMPRLNLDAES